MALVARPERTRQTPRPAPRCRRNDRRATIGSRLVCSTGRVGFRLSVGLAFQNVNVRGGRMFASLLGAWLGLATFTGAASNPDSAGKLSRFEFVATHMGSSFKILLYSTDAATARRASRLAFDRIAALDATLSDYQPESELSRLALKARGLVGSDKLLLDSRNRTVQLTRPGMRLDVGGIAKGYASQAAIDVLRSQGITRALVGGAGDIVVAGPPPDAAGWTIAIAGLNPSEAGPETYILLKNAAISTSGDAERFVIIAGHRYSHIINPVTGMGVEDRASVTVVAPDGGTADALETSVYLLGPERGLKLIETMPGTAALYVRSTPDGIRTFESSRFKQIPRTKPKA